jgi:hypothetical protein
MFAAGGAMQKRESPLPHACICTHTKPPVWLACRTLFNDKSRTRLIDTRSHPAKYGSFPIFPRLLIFSTVQKVLSLQSGKKWREKALVSKPEANTKNFCSVAQNPPFTKIATYSSTKEFYERGEIYWWPFKRC